MVSSAGAGFSAGSLAGTDPSTGSVRGGLAGVLRPPPRPWVPASAGTTISWAQGERSWLQRAQTLRRCSGQARYERGWLRCCGPAPLGSRPTYRVRGRLCAGTTIESPSPQPSPVEGGGVLEPGSGRTRGSAPTTGESPSPQPSPVKGEGVLEPGSDGGCVTLTPALSRRGRGGFGAGKRADTWVRPYDRGVTLTPALSR